VRLTISGKLKTSLNSAIAAAGTLVLLAFGLSIIQVNRLNSLLNPSDTLTDSDLAAEQRVDELRLSLLKELPTLGFDNLVANWTFLNFLQYFGDTPLRSKVGYTLSPEFFEVIVGRDPRFMLSYLYLTNSTSIYAAQPEQAVALMAQGLESLAPDLPSNSYLVWRYKAVDQLLFLGDSAAARESFDSAADWAEQSSDPEATSVAAISRQTARFLETNPSSRAAQISSWAQVLAGAVDDTTRNLAITRIEDLGGEVVVSGRGIASVNYRPDDADDPVEEETD
jgi:hypothetical protein